MARAAAAAPGAFADLLAWSAMVAEEPAVVLTKTGKLQTSLAYTCPDTKMMSPAARASYLSRLHGVLMTLNTGWTLGADWWHLPAPPYPEARWTHPAHWLVDELRRLAFQTSPRLVSTRYLTLTWTPPSPKRRWLRQVFYTRPATKHVRHTLDTDIAAFQGGMRRFIALLEPLWPTLESLTADATCAYLHQSISWQHHPVRCPVPALDLDWQLCDTSLVPGAPPRLGDQYLQPLTIGTWQQTMQTWLAEWLDEVEFPCRYHVSWVPLETRAAEKYLRETEKGWATSYGRASRIAKQGAGVKTEGDVAGRDSKADAIAAGRSVLETQEEVLLGLEAVGSLSPTVLCWGGDMETLTARVEALQAIMFGQGLVARTEEAGATLAWLATLPGHAGMGFRGRILRTQELTALIPHGSVWGGPEGDAHLKAGPLFVASTDATPFRFVSHVGELGHIVVAGPTRAGKSALLGLMVRQWFRYAGARLALFDRDYNLKAVTLLSGGIYYTPGVPGGPGFHVLGRIDTLAEQQWAATWIEGVLKGEELPPTPAERQEIWQAIQSLATLLPGQRTLTMYQRLLQVPRLKIGLAPFCAGGPYAFFDATEDAFSLEVRLVGFEMSFLLANPRAVNPALSFLFHRLEVEWFDGSPVRIIVDEAKWVLGIELFLGELEVWLKARAKLNVSITLSAQELVDFQRTRAYQAILASVPTWVFLPNANAGLEEVRPFYTGAGLGEEHLEMLAMAQPQRDYFYSSSLGQRLFQLRLSPVERLLCAASRPDEIRVLDALAATVSPAMLPAEFLAHYGYHEEADLLRTLQEQETPHVAMVDREQSHAGNGYRRHPALYPSDDADTRTDRDRAALMS